MRKLILFFSFFILTSTVFANTANPKIGGWQITSNIAHGIGARLTASKDVIVNGATKTMTSVASVSPNPMQVGKFLAKAGGVSIAIDAMDYLLDGVDYVMDPANNTVTYKKKPIANDSFDSCGECSTLTNVWHNDTSWVNSNKQYYASSEAAATADFKIKYPNYTLQKLTISRQTERFIYYNFTYIHPNGEVRSGNASEVYSTRVANPTYDPNAETQDKPITVPLSEVGSRVIDKAEEDIRAGNISPAVTLTRAVAQDLVKDEVGYNENVRPVPPIAQELAKNAVIPEEGTATGEIAPTESNPNGSSFAMEFPAFCGWASTVCLFIDWMQKEADIDEPELPTEEMEDQEIEDDLLNIGASHCPAPIDVNIPLPVFNTVYSDSFDFSPYCPEIKKLAPLFQLLTFFLCVMILARI